jgi:hypothetical protein
MVAVNPSVNFALVYEYKKALTANNAIAVSSKKTSALNFVNYSPIPSLFAFRIVLASYMAKVFRLFVRIRLRKASP